MGIALCFAVTPSRAAGRSIRSDNPANLPSCDLYYWTPSGDIFYQIDGNMAFNPGVAVTGPPITCEPGSGFNNGNLWLLWTSPLQGSGPALEASGPGNAANPASLPQPPSLTNPGVGLPTNPYLTAYAAILYQWPLDPNTQLLEAELVIWTLSTQDYEFEFDGWCASGTGTGNFTWMGNLYTVNCTQFAGEDLFINQSTGLPDGSVTYDPTNATTPNVINNSPGLLPSDWTLVLATSAAMSSVTSPLYPNTPFTLVVNVTDTGGNLIPAGNAQLWNGVPSGTTPLSTSQVNAGVATFYNVAGQTQPGSYPYTVIYQPAPNQNTLASSTPITLAVNPPLSLNVAPATIVLGQGATLTWSSIGGATCNASGAWSGTQSSSGSMQITPTAMGPTAYILTCTYTNTATNTSTSTSMTATLTVNAPPSPTVTVTVTPGTITLGQSATLTWSSTYATGCTADSAWSGAQAASGSLSVTPTTAGGFAYSLTCAGAGGKGNGAAALVVSAAQPPAGNAPTVTVTVTPGTITVGQSASLTWSSTNATSCTADSAWTGAQATSGTLSVSPSSAGGYAYSLTCTGAGGTANGAAGLSVTPAPPPQSDMPTVTITISPGTITVGQSAMLTWSSTNATSCAADSAWTGAQATSGTLSVSPSTAGGYAYSLSCSGAAGVGNGAVGLSVVPPATSDPAPAPSKSGGGSIALWELFALGGLLGWRLRRSASTAR